MNMKLALMALKWPKVCAEGVFFERLPIQATLPIHKAELSGNLGYQLRGTLRRLNLDTSTGCCGTIPKE